MSVVVVGSINRDVVARVSRIPGAGETVLASGLDRTGGGKGANQAVAAARAGGARVAFVGAVGDDADGAALREGLSADGVDVTGLETVAGPTGVALISVDDHAENAIVVVAGANAARDRLSAVQRARVTEAEVMVSQLEIPVDLVLDAADARGRDALHVLNAAPSSPFSTAREALLETIDVLVVNQHELADIAGTDRLDDGVDSLAALVPAVVVTLGAEGCLVAAGSARERIPAHSVRAVDTTGAGDTFCGVFAASLDSSGATRDRLDVRMLSAAARAGTAAAALAVGRRGAQEAVPTAAELAALRERTAGDQA